nr:bifunctional transaldolase/phosoglucose isomerase [Calditrichia bacterium]
IRRSFTREGKLKALVDDGVRGITSNPTIFQKAIAGSNDYDEDLQKLVKAGKSVSEVYESLAVTDIQEAADVLRPVYDQSEGLDGYVSLEVSPTLARETQKTIDEAVRLYEWVARPNLMIKVPATPEGIPAIAELIGRGINVNVTLIFSLSNYQQVMDAYLKGLETLHKNGPVVKGGHKIDRIASVASFFISRVDSSVDKELAEKGNKDLLGQIGIANAKVAYQMFLETFSGARWEKFAAAGASVQRPLWASTGTKNPAYSDTLYMDELIGADTVNTAPPATLDNFVDHGTVATTLTKDVELARKQLEDLRKLGVDLDAITDKLQDDGVDSFADSFADLMDSVAKRRAEIALEKMGGDFLGEPFRRVINNRLLLLKDKETYQRLWQKDHTLWKENPQEIANRLGWLDSPAEMAAAVEELAAFTKQAVQDGFTHAMLLGMGGSSMAPEVFRYSFGVKKGYLDLVVLDSTDPGAVLDRGDLDPAKTLYVVATKSGGTVETLSFMKFFYRKAVDALGEKKAGAHFVAITDPGSKLAETAQKLNFRKTFLNNPDIGGRYSALSYFGLVAAALIGAPVAEILENARSMAYATREATERNTPALFGTIMGELAMEGKDKLTLVTSKSLTSFGAWAEQLIAESLGKEGKGVLPVDLEYLGNDPSIFSRDRYFVHLRLAGEGENDLFLTQLAEAGFPVLTLHLPDLTFIGAEFFRWEVATALAGMVMDINPFDQPNVESAKVKARDMVEAFHKSGNLPELPVDFENDDLRAATPVDGDSFGELIQNFMGKLPAGGDSGAGRGYVAIHAYVNPTDANFKALQQLRTAIQKKWQVATTLGFGPRFLHSTGQLHKGDAGNGLFIQINGENTRDADIPNSPDADRGDMSFGVLKNAQAMGDRQALLDNGRAVLSLHLKKRVDETLMRLAEQV